METRYQNANILVVDDEPADAGLLKRILEQAGYVHVHVLADGREVIRQVIEFSPDIILLDLRMPEPDGFEVMRLVHEQITHGDFLPILVVTADGRQTTKRRALASGANDYLTKPYDRPEVLLRTRNLLHARFLHWDLRTRTDSLEDKVREQTQALRASQMEILIRLAAVGELRDDATGQHTRRVGDLSAQVATALGVLTKQAEMIRLAAQLHDIGKAAVPDSIILKPAKLTQEEFEAMKRHTTIGAEILGRSEGPLLRLAEEIALTHHEWWEGGGYPNGLRGEDIPIAGRIVAVTDAFDALTHERPYKHAWSVADAVAEIRHLAGRQFDPDVAEALFQVVMPGSEPPRSSRSQGET